MVLARFELRMRRKCYFQASGQKSDIAIGFSDPDFLNESNNLEITGSFQVFSTVQIKNLPHFYFRSISSSDLER